VLRRRVVVTPIISRCGERYESIRLRFFILRDNLAVVEETPKACINGVIDPSRTIDTHHGTTTCVIGKKDNAPVFYEFDVLVRKCTVPS
jgi:hypothetical protein